MVTSIETQPLPKSKTKKTVATPPSQNALMEIAAQYGHEIEELIVQREVLDKEIRAKYQIAKKNGVKIMPLRIAIKERRKDAAVTSELLSEVRKYHQALGSNPLLWKQGELNLEAAPESTEAASEDEASDPIKAAKALKRGA